MGGGSISISTKLLQSRLHTSSQLGNKICASPKMSLTLGQPDVLRWGQIRKDALRYDPTNYKQPHIKSPPPQPERTSFILFNT